MRIPCWSEARLLPDCAGSPTRADTPHRNDQQHKPDRQHPEQVEPPAATDTHPRGDARGVRYRLRPPSPDQSTSPNVNGYLRTTSGETPEAAGTGTSSGGSLAIHESYPGGIPPRRDDSPTEEPPPSTRHRLGSETAWSLSRTGYAGGRWLADEASPGHHEHAIWRHSATSVEACSPHSHAENCLRAQLGCEESRLQIGYRKALLCRAFPLLGERRASPRHHDNGAGGHVGLARGRENGLVERKALRRPCSV